MKARRLLAFSILAIAFGCEGHQSPTAPGAVKSVPFDSTAVLSDGAHGGNPDFFFLPPLVPLPLNNPNFELGKFNNTLGPGLKIEICKLNPEYNPITHLQILPLPHTQCVTGNPVKTFPAGSVQLVNLPLSQTGWWTAHNLPPDGFYYVLWDTRQSNLDVNSYYRIKVFVDGNAIPMGFADVDPMSNLWQWRSALTGQVIQLVNGWLLPIPFRIEKGALCGGANSCTSTIVTNFSPTGFQTVTVDGGAGAIAGAKFPNGWLPAGGPQSVVVTISSVNTGPSDPATGTQTNPCHAALNLQQFDSCFKFTTTPTLVPQTNGKQFAIPVTVAVCYVLQGTGDPREKFAEIYASGPTEPPHALPDVSDAGILGAGTRNCSITPVITSRSSNPLARLATTGWRKVKVGFDRMFGVETAYAIDVGLGGLLDGFSNVGPALTAQIQRYTSTGLTLPAGATTTSTARIVGTKVHNGSALTTGIGGLPVTFTVAPGNGTLRLIGSEAPPATQLTSITNTNPIDGSPVSGGGFAPVNWTIPTTPGTYTLTATGRATGGPVTFTATVPPVIVFNTWTSLTADGHHTCGLTSGGAAYCWGSTVSPSTTPMAVAGGITFASLTGGGTFHTCGLTGSGAAYCWGSNNNGQLGDGTTTNRTTPVAVAGGITFASLTAGMFHTCGLTSGRVAYCWGSNADGGLGDGTTTNRTTPVAVAGELTFASLSAGASYTCGLTSGGAAYCWGYNGDGNLGDGTEISRTTQAAVAGGLTFGSLSTGTVHTCGLTSGGAAYCWGYNREGGLGDGSTTERTTPVAVAGGLTFASLAAGTQHTCGLTSRRAAYCWGFNLSGQLGNGTTISPSTTPVPVAGELTFASLTAGEDHTCGLTSGETAYCWGRNFAGQLGDGTTTSRTTPVAVANR
jgi:alpha-tubulin suppressor-like RCC1 family protein